MSASDDHTSAVETVTVFGYETAKEDDERAADVSGFDVSWGDGWSASNGQARDVSGRGRGRGGGLPATAASVAAGLRGAGIHHDDMVRRGQATAARGDGGNPDRIAEAAAGPVFNSGARELLAPLQKLGLDIRPSSTRPSEADHPASVRALGEPVMRTERSAPAAQLVGARPERGIRGDTANRPASHQEGARPPESPMFSTQFGTIAVGSSAGAAAIAAVGIAVGGEVSVQATIGIGAKGVGGGVTAGVFLVTAGLGASIGKLGSNIVVTYEPPDDGSPRATTGCAPQVVLATPLGSLQFAGRQFDSVTLSFGPALALGVFSGISCGVALPVD